MKVAQDKTIEVESALRAKDKYIEQLHDENDEFKSNLEKLGFETFLRLKNDLFAQEQKLDLQAIQKQYIPIYEELEGQVNEMLEKYKQQEEAN